MAGELVGLAGRGKDEKGNFGVAEDGELVGFLQKPIPTLRERHLPTRRIFDSLQLHFPSSHFSRSADESDFRLFSLQSESESESSLSLRQDI